jgi:hypothetical protein
MKSNTILMVTGGIVLVGLYMLISTLIITFNKPPLSEAMYEANIGNYEGWWLLPEDNILFKTGYITINDKGITYEVAGFWMRKGVTWVYVPDSAKFETFFIDPQKPIKIRFGSHER